MKTPAIPPDAWRRRAWLLRLAAAATAAAPAPGRAGYNIWTQTYTVEMPEIAARLARHFPLTVRPSPLLAAELSEPAVALHPETNRLSVATRVRIASPLLARVAQGALAMQTGLRFQADDRTVRLYQPDAERLELDALSRRDNQNLQLAASALAREALDGYPLHRFAPEDLRYGGRSFEPGEIRVTAQGIEVQLRPA
ncbi:hypothetical protein [Xylophilus sp.]|uniref:hypothetical protein n=1 Tax=Xylophilus sp. TaxID=2653893 RepID=UPI002D807BD2|nr:hypothetical protein [Xylophilus sp.]